MTAGRSRLQEPSSPDKQAGARDPGHDRRQLAPGRPGQLNPGYANWSPSYISDREATGLGRYIGGWEVISIVDVTDRCS